MRLSTAQMYNSGMLSMQQSYGRLNHVNNQMGTGKKNVTPADDPVAAAQTLNTKTRLDVVEQYNRNIDFGYKNLDLSESVLGQAEESLIRLKEIAIQLGSDQWSPEQIKSSAMEAKNFLEHLQGLVNTRNESDEYIFAGSQANSAAYVNNIFQGDAVEREAQAADSVFVKMLTTGDRAFENLDISKLHTDSDDPDKQVYFYNPTNPNDPNHAAPPTDPNDPDEVGFRYPEDPNNPPEGYYPNNMLGVVQYFVDAAQAGQGEDAIPDKKAMRNAIQNIDMAFDKVSRTRSHIGARQNTLEALKESNTDFAVFAKKSVSDLEDLDYADAIMRIQTSMLSYQAGMQAIGKVAGLSLFNYI